MINKFRKIVYCILLSFLLCSCRIKINQNIEQKNYTGNVALNIYVHDMKIKLKIPEIDRIINGKNELKEENLFVYAEIIIDNVDKKDGNFELQKIRLGYDGGIFSTTTYYDTFVSRDMQPIEIKR